MKQIILVSSMAIALIIAFAAGSMLQPTGIAQTSSTTDNVQRTISLSGTGIVTTSPDALTATIGVTSLELSLAEALADNNQKMTAIIDLLKSLGIADEDIQTSNFNVSVERENFNGPITGYRVSNAVSVLIRDLDAAGSILDQAVGAGANEIYGIGFTVSERGELESQARAAAVADALSKAQELVDAAGVQLGEVLTINAFGGSGTTNEAREFDFAASESSVPLQGGQIQVRIDVEVTLAIE